MQEQLESLPKGKEEFYRYKLYVKEKTRATLSFLQLEKSKIPENLRGQLFRYVESIGDLIGPYRRSKDRKAEMDARHKSQISRARPQTDISNYLAPSDGGSRLV